MIELELLGLHPDGDRLSLNDADGNRYILPITADLRAALRKDLRTSRDDEPRPVTPKEIQAHFRAGLTMAEVSELTSLPPSQLEGLAHPILAERRYNADLARGYRQGQELGGMTLDELVTSRLIPRGVSANQIEWDSYKKPNGPWILIASYEVSGDMNNALWTLDTKAQTIVAANDEASWLTETQIPAPTSPWRPLNTPSMEKSDEAIALESRRSKRVTAEPATVLDAEPASAGRPLSIDDMLDSLDSQRGKAQPMPSGEEFLQGAHPAASEPEKATDATILSLPDRTIEPDDESDTGLESDTSSAEDQQFENTTELVGLVPESGAENDDEITSKGSDFEDSDADISESGESALQTEVTSSTPLPGQQELPGMEQVATKSEGHDEKPKKRRGRPEMPSWDEIVFGYSKDD